MKQAIQLYLKRPMTILGVVIALMAQIIFCLVWMTAYDGILDREDQMTVAIVNEDGQGGAKVADQLKGALPFQVEQLSGEKARDGLLNRDIQLVVTIPELFSKDLATPGVQAKLEYTSNDAYAQIGKSVVQNVVGRISNELNATAALQGTEGVLEQLKLPKEQAESTAKGLLNKVVSESEVLNPVPNYKNQMAAMAIVLASFVGAMQMAGNIETVARIVGQKLSARQHFTFRILLNVGSSAFISIVGSSLVAMFGAQMNSGFGMFWLFHFLTLTAFMFVAQMLLALFGMSGMFINMALLSIQLVTMGTVVPKQLLNGFYDVFGRFLPATYAAEGLMSLQFGGAQTGKDAWVLVLFIAISLIVTASMLVIKQKAAVKKTVNSAIAPQPAAN